MDNSIITGIFTAMGLMIGWLLNEISQIINIRRENSKVINEVLHNQLKIWKLISKTNFEEVEKQLSTLLHNKFPDNPTNQTVDILNHVFKSFMEYQIYENFGKAINEVMLDYVKSINKLATITPLIAFEIGAKEKVLDYLGFIDTYLQHVSTLSKKPILIDDNYQEEKVVQTYSDTHQNLKIALRGLLYKEALETIKEDILLITNKIGYFSNYKVKRILNKKILLTDQDIAKIKSFIEL